jgi:hypothetical protein
MASNWFYRFGGWWGITFLLISLITWRFTEFIEQNLIKSYGIPIEFVWEKGSNCFVPLNGLSSI